MGNGALCSMFLSERVACEVLRIEEARGENFDSTVLNHVMRNDTPGMKYQLSITIIFFLSRLTLIF